MNIRELHIRVQTQLQLIGAYVYGQIREPEMDLLIHQALINTITKYYNKYKSGEKSGFSSNTQNLAALQGYQKEETIQCYTLTNNIVYGNLPYDYMLPIREEAKTSYNCIGLSRASQVSSFKIAKISIAEYTSPVPLAYYYDNFKIKFDTSTVFDFNNYRNLQAELESSDAKFYLINLILEVLNDRSDCKVYWEYFQGEYYPNQLIITTFNAYSSVNLEYHDPLLDFAFPFVTSTRSLYVPINSFSDVQISDIRLVSSEEIVKKRQNPYEKTNFKSPLAEIYRNRIFLDCDTSFFVREVKLVYIKKPIMPNYYLNNNLESNNELFISDVIEETLKLCKQSLNLN
jgi:hypothetical protein